MSASRIVTLAAAFGASTTAAPAQIPAHTDESAPVLEFGTMQPVMDRAIFTHVIFNELEGQFNGTNPEFRWEGQGWVGTDYDKLWIKSEGTFSNGTLDDGQQQFLFSRAITTYFDLQGGLRSDLNSRPTRNWAAFGTQGLAPYFFDLEATGYIGSQGHLAGKLEASYDLLLTQRLILQSQIELNIYSKGDPARLVGAGFSDIDTGIRLRYELAGNSRPISASSIKGNSGRRQISHAKLARARAMCASSLASASGFERGYAHRHRLHRRSRPSCSSWRSGLFVFRHLRRQRDRTHWAVTRWMLETARTRSVKAHSAGVEAPPGLDGPATILIGVEHFAAHCAVCHGAPGVPKGDIAKGLNPHPRSGACIRALHRLGAVLILKHGIKMTGMPAWNDHSDEELWATVAFLQQLPAMSEEDYARLVMATMERNAPHHHDSGNQGRPSQ